MAVEPVPKICEALTRNVKVNHFDNRVKILNIALGESNGVVSFHEAEDSTMGSLAVDGYQGQRGRLIEVQCRILDSVVEELKIEPDFMKIDVEGFEHIVLSGATAMLNKYHPRIVLEANPGDRADLVTEILSRHGYSFHNITDGGLEKRSEIQPREDFRNWLCVPAS